MIANGNKDVANQIRKEYVHKLGNLTLTGYNSNLGNLSLSKKQDRKNNDGKFIGYKNGLILNETIKDVTTWTKENIETRTNYLVEKALEIFRL
jgi:recombinational DNA repair protein RecT